MDALFVFEEICALAVLVWYMKRGGEIDIKLTARRRFWDWLARVCGALGSLILVLTLVGSGLLYAAMKLVPNLLEYRVLVVRYNAINIAIACVLLLVMYLFSLMKPRERVR